MRPRSTRLSLVPRLRRDDGLTQVALVALLFSVALAGAAVGVGARALFDDEGVESSAAAARAVSILAYDCPGGEPIAEMSGGDRLFLMARDGDGWLRTRDPRPPHVAWWILASAVDPDAPTSTLPEAACGDELPDEAGIDGTAESTEDPATTTTALDDTTTSTTTSAPGTTTSTLAGTTTTTTPGTTTTTAPDTTPPTIASKSATPDEIWEQDGLVVSCPSENDRQSTISAVVTDNFGVMSVTASWSDPDGIQNAPMSVVGSNYTSTFGPYPAGKWDPFNTFPYDHSVTITITARDAAGNKSSTTVSVTVWEIGHCLI